MQDFLKGWAGHGAGSPTAPFSQDVNRLGMAYNSAGNLVSTGGSINPNTGEINQPVGGMPPLGGLPAQPGAAPTVNSFMGAGGQVDVASLQAWLGQLAPIAGFLPPSPQLMVGTRGRR